MATVCSYFKYGFCKYGSTCRRQHIVEKCENENCDKINCEKRQPHMCRYYQQYRRCRFGEFCAYEHFNVVDPVIQELIELKARLSEIELQLKQKNCEILTLLGRLKISSDLTFQDISPSPKKVNIGVNTDSGMA